MAANDERSIDPNVDKAVADSVEAQQAQPRPNAVIPAPAPASGKRPFRNIRRELEEIELTSPGVPQLLLAMIESADSECERLKSFETKYHEVNIRASVLDAKQKSHKVIDIAFGAGVGLGGAALGLAPTMWDKQPLGWSLIVAAVVMIGAGIAAKWFEK